MYRRERIQICRYRKKKEHRKFSSPGGRILWAELNFNQDVPQRNIRKGRTGSACVLVAIIVSASNSIIVTVLM